MTNDESLSMIIQLSEISEAMQDQGMASIVDDVIDKIYAHDSYSATTGFNRYATGTSGYSGTSGGSGFSGYTGSSGIMPIRDNNRKRLSDDVLGVILSDYGVTIDTLYLLKFDISAFELDIIGNDIARNTMIDHINLDKLGDVIWKQSLSDRIRYFTKVLSLSDALEMSKAGKYFDFCNKYKDYDGIECDMMLCDEAIGFIEKFYKTSRGETVTFGGYASSRLFEREPVKPDAKLSWWQRFVGWIKYVLNGEIKTNSASKWFEQK